MNYVIVLGSLLLLVESTLGAGSWPWTYEGANGPGAWYTHHSKCNGKSQSPIDVPLSKVKYDTSYGNINYNNYDAANIAAYTLKNNGHAIQVDVTNGLHTISGGKLPTNYILGQFHFHWGTGNNVGSEHFINGKQYPMEMHLVHYSSQYSGIGDAKEHSNGLAVIGVMFKIGGENSVMNIIINSLNRVKHEGQSYQITPFALKYLLPDNRNEYFRYSGSLTTPTCDESVVWTVLNNPITISQSQMDAFRTALYAGSVGDTSHALGNNYRPIQDLNSRDVYCSFPANSAYHISLSVSSIFIILFSYAV